MRDDPVFAIAQVLVFVKIILTGVLLDPRSLDTFTLPKSVAAHSTSLVIAALLVWLLARHGRSVLTWSPLHVPVGLLVFTFAIATPFALDPTIALFGSFRRYLGLTQMLDNAVLYLSVALLFRDARSQRLLAIVVGGVALPVLLYAMVQRLGLDPLTFQQGLGVPISFLGNPDVAGAFVAVIGVTMAGLAYLLPGQWIAWWRLLAGLIALACLGTLLLTGARAGVLAIGFGWVAAIVVAWLMPALGRRRALVGVSAAVVLAVGVAVSPMAGRLNPAFIRADASWASRVDVWTAALKGVVERPVLGWGPDNFVAIYPALRTKSSIPSQVLENSTHDLWLYVATSAGMIGWAALLLLTVLAIDNGVRLARRNSLAGLALIPLVAYLGQAFVNVNEIAVDWMFWVAIGIIAAAAARGVAPTSRRAAPREARSVGILALAAALGIAGYAVVPRILAGENMLAAEAYANAHRGNEAVSYGQALATLDPRRGESWSTYGRALHERGDRAAAVMAFEAAAQRQPWHPLSWENLAIAWSALGNQNAALAAAERAPIADPYDGVGHEIAAQAAYEQKQFERSAAHGERAIAYEYPAQESAYFTTISAYVQLKDLARAETLGRRAVEQYPTPRLRLQLAAILADEKKTSEALSLVDAVLKDQPSNVPAQQLRDAILKE